MASGVASNNGGAQASTEPAAPGQVAAGGNAPDYMPAILNQLGGIQRSVGALSEAHKFLAQFMHAAEARISSQVHASEDRTHAAVQDLNGQMKELKLEMKDLNVQLTSRIDKLDDDVTSRLRAVDSRHLQLRERVNKVLWTAAGVCMTLGLAFGWRHIVVFLGTYVAGGN